MPVGGPGFPAGGAAAPGPAAPLEPQPPIGVYGIVIRRRPPLGRS
jgi:hypothetical protein